MPPRCFGLDVLRHYADQPEKYRVEDTAIDGHISIRDPYYLRLSEEQRRDEIGSLQYLKKKLLRGGQVLVPIPIDFQRLPRKHRLRWESCEVKDAVLAPIEQDPEYRAALEQNLDGRFIDPPDDPVFGVSEALRGVNAVRPLYRREDNPQLGLPFLNNERDYSASHNELRKLVGPDNLDVKEIKNLIESLGVDFQKEDKPWALFKKLVANAAGDRRDEILGPFERVPQKRSLLTHEIRDSHASSEDFVERFKGDCRDLANALTELATGLRKSLSQKE